jgi:hypothetical protein
MTMARGYVVYILMFVALGVGLWAVLRLGTTLQAPAEIAGTWQVQWETAPPTGSGFKGTMTVDQSGRFCTFHFDNTRTMSLKMVAGTALGQGDPQSPIARLVGEGYDMTIHPTAVRDAVRLEISGRDHHVGFAERLNRPGDRAAAAAPSPTVVPPVADARR